MKSVAAFRSCMPEDRSFDVAVYESLFHSVGPRPASRTWPASRIDAVAHSVLNTARDLHLAPLFRRNLIAWRVTDQQLIRAPARNYTQTVAWAEAVHRSIPDADGMVWVGRIPDFPEQCVGKDGL